MATELVSASPVKMTESADAEEPSTTGADPDPDGISGALVLYVAKQLVERYRDKAPELGPERGVHPFSTSRW